MSENLLARWEWARPARRLAGAVVDLCYPRACADCGAEVDRERLRPIVCDRCRDSYLDTAVRRMPEAARVSWQSAVSDVFCRRCGSFAARALDGPDGSPLAPASCASCVDWKRTGIDGAIPLGRYEGRLREAVLRMKSPAGDGIAAAMADVVWQVRGDLIAGIGAEVIVPVPMHRWQRMIRGASSAERLATTLGRNARIRVERGLLRRRRNTLKQGELTPEGRRRNVAGAFCVTAGYDLRGLRVLLVDDVLTTGATANEAARVLRRAGVSGVYAVVVARTEHTD